jgi:flagellar basal body-associated protein FliL
MADDEDLAQSAAPKSRKMLGAAVLVGVIVAEGALIFGAMRLLGDSGAASAAGGEIAPTAAAANDSAFDSDTPADVAEIVVAETDAFNDRSGRLHMYHIQVTAVVRAAAAERLEKLVEQRSGTIRDRINTVIRGADPKHLNEPGLETLRRQIQFELNKIVGNDSLILELLIPELLQSRTSL